MSNIPPPPEDRPGAGNNPGNNPYNFPSADQVANEAGGFFRKLFDFKFRKFITPEITGIVYAIAIGLIGLTWLFFTISAFRMNIGFGFVALIIGPIVALVYIIFIRMGMEFVVASIRTAQNTGELVARKK